MAYNCKDEKCPWAKNLTPVEGWKATPTKVLVYKNYADSYIVHNCPLYELMGELKHRKVENAGRVRPNEKSRALDAMFRGHYKKSGKEKRNEHEQSAGD